MRTNDLIRALEPVVKLFNDLGVGYYIGGSVASSAYGVARATLDIDLVTPLSLAHVKSLVEGLKSEFYIDEDMISEAIKTKSSFNLIHLESMVKIDVFILKEKPFYKKVFERRIKDTLEDTDSPFAIYLCSPEDVILTKLQWYKIGGKISEHQWLDILGVFKVQHEKLDMQYLKTWAKELSVDDLLDKALKESEVNN